MRFSVEDGQRGLVVVRISAQAIPHSAFVFRPPVSVGNVDELELLKFGLVELAWGTDIDPCSEIKSVDDRYSKLASIESH